MRMKYFDPWCSRTHASPHTHTEPHRHTHTDTHTEMTQKLFLLPTPPHVHAHTYCFGDRNTRRQACTCTTHTHTWPSSLALGWKPQGPNILQSQSRVRCGQSSEQWTTQLGNIHPTVMPIPGSTVHFLRTSTSNAGLDTTALACRPKSIFGCRTYRTLHGV